MHLTRPMGQVRGSPSLGALAHTCTHVRSAVLQPSWKTCSLHARGICTRNRTCIQYTCTRLAPSHAVLVCGASASLLLHLLLLHTGYGCDAATSRICCIGFSNATCPACLPGYGIPR